MSARELKKLGSDTLRLALMASAELGRELGAGEEGDTKRAKDLCSHGSCALRTQGPSRSALWTRRKTRGNEK